MIPLGFWIYPLSLLGVSISAYVWYSHRFHKPIACWTQDCDRIIRSSYSRLLGIHNSAIGFWVFLLIFLMTALDHVGLTPRSDLALSPVAALSFIGSLVSLYLTYIQLLVLKGICNWCMTSAALVLAIFILTLTSG